MGLRERLTSLEAKRLAIGLVQGGLLFAVLRIARDGNWPHGLDLTFSPLICVMLLIPPVAISGLGKLRRGPLLSWIGIATVAVAMLGFYGAYRRVGSPDPLFEEGPPLLLMAPGTSLLPPTAVMVAFYTLALFITHCLVLAAASDGRRIARYPTYFDTAWTVGLQVLCAAVFTGFLWGALTLGAALFHLIHVDFFQHLFEKGWFAWPVTTASFALALHVSDIRPEWVRPLRRLALLLLSWLLPLLTLFVAGFLLTLPFIGVDALWKTRYAASLMLWVACALIGLVNATYQQGEGPVHVILRWSSRIAAIALVPLTALGFWAIWLRVDQYGLSAERVLALAGVVVIACGAIGYCIATLRPGPWLKGLETVNIAVAVVTVADIVAIMSPIADPARLAVASQVARLESGAVTSEKFDFKALRFDGERYGQEALKRLAQTNSGPDAASIRERASKVATMKNRWGPDAVVPADIAQNITVHPEGKKLDPAFLATDWEKEDNFRNFDLPKCLFGIDQSCDAVVVDLDQDGIDDVVIADPWTAWVFQQGADKKWHPVNPLAASDNLSCTDALQALRSGAFTLVSPDPPKWRDIAIDGERIHVAAAKPQITRPVKRCW